MQNINKNYLLFFLACLILSFPMMKLIIYEHNYFKERTPVSVECPNGSIITFKNWSEYNNQTFICGKNIHEADNHDKFINYQFPNITNGVK